MVAIGDTVRILDGNFRDFVGLVASIDERTGELVVMVRIFGRDTPVGIGVLAVERVDPSPERGDVGELGRPDPTAILDE